MVIGLNHRTASLAMRERFWISEHRRYEILKQLKSAEGIEEVVVLCTCGRTEFMVWASEPTLAANSLLQFLSSEHGLGSPSGSISTGCSTNPPSCSCSALPRGSIRWCWVNRRSLDK